MPELPEVECLTRAVRPLLEGHRLSAFRAYRADLRVPIPVTAIDNIIVGQQILRVFRRSKYIVIQTHHGSLIIHLGMSGRLLSKSTAVPDVLHTHAVFSIESSISPSKFLHFVDPRRFGLIECAAGTDLSEHVLFKNLGPEPLVAANLADYLFEKSRGCKRAIKNFLMDADVLVGVGNIYAAESLFNARISPVRKAGRVSHKEFVSVTLAVRRVLQNAIDQGGTTFRDYQGLLGQPGYFAVKLNVYGREGLPCVRCKRTLRLARLGGRSSVYCSNCQR